MRKKEIKKILLDDLNENYSFDVDFNKIYDNYLEKNAVVIQEKKIIHDYKKNPFKLATTYLSVALTCCIVVLCVVIGKCVNMHNDSKKIIYPQLRSYIEERCVEFNDTYFDSIAFSNTVKMYIFEGYTSSDNDGEVYYFYSFTLSEENTITLIVDDVSKTVTNETYGILTKFKNDGEIHTLNFSISSDEKTVKYSLQK